MNCVIPMLMLASLCVSSVPAAAADTSNNVFGVVPASVATQPGPAALDHHVKRPALLPVLYASFGAVQASDVYTTSAALRSGAYEANPLMRPFAGHPARMIALKAAATASTIFFVERMWKQQHRVAAVVMMAAINGATMAVAMNNARIARRGR